MSYSEDALDYDDSSPYGYREYKKDLFRYGRRYDTPYPPHSPTPASELSTNSTSVIEGGLEATLSPGLPHTWNLEDLVIDFEEKRKNIEFRFFVVVVFCP